MSKINISELKRIVKLANDLDGKGLHKEADLLDSVIAGFKKMAGSVNATETPDVSANTREPEAGQHPTVAEKESVARQVNNLIVPRMRTLGTVEDDTTEPYKTLKAAYDAGKAYVELAAEDTNGASKTNWNNAFRVFYKTLRKDALQGSDGPVDTFGDGYGWMKGNVLYELWADGKFNVSRLNSDTQQVETVRTSGPEDLMRGDGDNKSLNPNSNYLNIIRMGYQMNDAKIKETLDNLLKNKLKVGDYNYNQIVSQPAAEGGTPNPTTPTKPAEPPPAEGGASTPTTPTKPAEPPPPPPAAGEGEKVDLRSAINSLAAGSMTVSNLGGGTCYMMPSPQGGNKGKEIGVFVGPRFETPLPYVIRKKTGDNLRIIREGRGWSPFGGISQTEKRQLESFKLTVQDMIKSSLEARPTAGSPPAADAPAGTPPAPTAPTAAPPPAGTTGTAGTAPGTPPAAAGNNALDSLTKKYSYFSKGIIRR